MLAAAPAGAAAQPLDVLGVGPGGVGLAPPAPPDDELDTDDDAVPAGVQHCSLAGPGQKPGVAT
jgi:hypothetical protein